MDLQTPYLHDWCYIDSLHHDNDSNCNNNISSDFPIYQMPTQNISFADLLCRRKVFLVLSHSPTLFVFATVELYKENVTGFKGVKLITMHVLWKNGIYIYCSFAKNLYDV